MGGIRRRRNIPYRLDRLDRLDKGRKSAALSCPTYFNLKNRLDNTVSTLLHTWVVDKILSMNSIDWVPIEREYKLGQLSLFQIARIYGVTARAVRDRAKEYGWSRGDLSSEVLLRSGAKLISDEALGEAGLEDGVERAAQTVVQVTREHRAEIGKLRALVTRASEALQRIMSENDLQPGDVNVIGFRQGTAESIDKLASALMKIVGLERQAFGMDEAQAPSPEAVRTMIESAKTELAKRSGEGTRPAPTRLN